MTTPEKDGPEQNEDNEEAVDDDDMKTEAKENYIKEGLPKHDRNNAKDIAKHKSISTEAEDKNPKENTKDNVRKDEDTNKKTINIIDCADSDDVRPLKLGVRLHPATLSLVYVTKDGTERLRTMPVRCLSAYGSITLPLSQLRERHQKYLCKVPDVRLQKLLRLLQESARGSGLEAAVATVAKEFSVDPLQNLNTLSDAELTTKKQIMEHSFARNQVVPGDAAYHYDTRVDYATGSADPAGWDSAEESDQFWD